MLSLADRSDHVRRVLLGASVSVALLLAVLVFVFGGAGAALAFTVSTAYPEVTVKAGQTVDLELVVRDTVIQRAALSLEGVPEGWEANFLGGGRPVSAVMTDPEEERLLSLQTKVPADAAEGPVSITVVARTAGETITLPIKMTVSREEGGTTTLSAEYSSLRGPAADAEFSFNLTLENESEQERTYNLSVNAPEGWTVSLKPSGATQETPTVTVQPGSSQMLNLKVTPPKDAEAGKYDLAVMATGGGEEVVTPLQVEITGTYNLVLTTPDGRLNAEIDAGSTTKVTFVVQNNGTAPVQGLKLSATPPTNWEVAFDPSVIDVLPPNQQQEVVAKFTPAENAIAGDYMVTMNARAEDASTSSDIRVTVKTSTLWGVIGVLIAIAAIVILALIFRRFGHR